MKKVFVSILCLATLSALSQDKGMAFKTTPPAPMAIINGHIEHAPNDTMVTLYEPYSGDTASAIIKNHKFKLRMPMSKGGSMYIMQMGAIASPQTGMVIYLEDGVMNVKGKGRDFEGSTRSGANYVKEWKEVSGITDPYSGEGKKFAELQKKYFEAKAIGDEDVMETVEAEAIKVESSINNKLKNWISKNPDSGVCGYILTVYFSKDKKFVDSVYERLGEHAKNSRILQRYKNPGKVDPALVSLKAGEGTAPENNGKVKQGTPAPNFEIPDVAGNIVKLSDFKGKYVFIDFWASWCSPCIVQVPHMKEINEKYKSKNFVFIGVSLDSKKQGWEKAIEKHGLNWLNVSNLKGWAEPVAVLYGVGAIPANVLIDPNGNVVANDLGSEALIKKLDELLK